jgi:hypothetical protein
VALPRVWCDRQWVQAKAIPHIERCITGTGTIPRWVVLCQQRTGRLR